MGKNEIRNKIKTIEMYAEIYEDCKNRKKLSVLNSNATDSNVNTVKEKIVTYTIKYWTKKHVKNWNMRGNHIGVRVTEKKILKSTNLFTDIKNHLRSTKSFDREKKANISLHEEIVFYREIIGDFNSMADMHSQKWTDSEDTTKRICRSLLEGSQILTFEDKYVILFSESRNSDINKEKNGKALESSSIILTSGFLGNYDCFVEPRAGHRIIEAIESKMKNGFVWNKRLVVDFR